MTDSTQSSTEEICDFATRVLFSPSIEDKLRSPSALSDRRQSQALHSLPNTPAREGTLTLHTLGARKRQKRELRPSIDHLQDPLFRARLLHTFAHHELISLELMALALLRFPEAPKAFRRGLAQVLIDEQRHFRLYTERIVDLGLELGEEPVSDYFWRCVAAAPNIESFNARLSLVFEQANIDFTRHYAPLFRAAGDEESAAALDLIYHDEISHVGIGLHWFRRWRPNNEPEWDSFCQLLEPPLSPGRARGPVFSDQGRRAAGFSEDYIQTLKLWGGSTGRPPIVWHGNFDVEGELYDVGVQRGEFPKDQSPRRRAKRRSLRRDIHRAFTPALAWMCTRGDIIYTPLGSPSERFQSLVMKARGLNPEWSVDLASLESKRLGGLRPWGWSHVAHTTLSSLLPSILSSGLSPPSDDELDNIAELFNKRWDIAVRDEVMSALSQSEESCPLYAPLSKEVKYWRVDENSSLEESLDRCLQEMKDASHSQWVCKRLLGSAGRGLKFINPHQELDPPSRGWMKRSLTMGLIAEPAVERVADLSFHGQVTTEEVRYDGEVLGIVDAQGQFQGAHIGPVSSGLNQEIKRFLNHDGRDRRRLTRIGRSVITTVGASLQRVGYRGYFGVDALITRDSDTLRLYPVVEVNPRLTMGRVALAARSLFDPRGERGLMLKIYSSLTSLLVKRDTDSQLTLEELSASVETAWDESGRWRGRYLPLTDIWADDALDVPVIMITPSDPH